MSGGGVRWTHLENITAFVGNEQDIELFEWLIDESHICGFYSRMLRVGRDEFWERSE